MLFCFNALIPKKRTDLNLPKHKNCTGSSDVYEGNVNEPKTLSKMLHDLEKGGTSTGQKPTVVMDAGIATEDNITWLQEHHYPYLVVSRKKHREFDEALSVVVKKDDECTVRAQKVFNKETLECIVCAPVRQGGMSPHYGIHIPC